MSDSETHPAPLAVVDDLEQAFQRQMQPFLERVKQMTLEIVDEVSKKHGTPFVVQVRETLVETVGIMLKTEVAARLDRLKPAVAEGSDSLRKTGEHMLADLKEFITKTVANVFQEQIPGYSSKAGRRMIDYFLAGTLLCLSAVLLVVGGVQALEHAGLRPYLAYLVGGGVSLGLGMVYLKVRARRWRSREQAARQVGEKSLNQKTC